MGVPGPEREIGHWCSPTDLMFQVCETFSSSVWCAAAFYCFQGILHEEWVSWPFVSSLHTGPCCLPQHIQCSIKASPTLQLSSAHITPAKARPGYFPDRIRTTRHHIALECIIPFFTSSHSAVASASRQKTGEKEMGGEIEGKERKRGAKGK